MSGIVAIFVLLNLNKTVQRDIYKQLKSDSIMDKYNPTTSMKMELSLRRAI